MLGELKRVDLMGMCIRSWNLFFNLISYLFYCLCDLFSVIILNCEGIIIVFWLFFDILYIIWFFVNLVILLSFESFVYYYYRELGLFVCYIFC